MAVSRIQDEVLQCTICYNVFQSPKTLPCLHTFCLECLSTYISQFANRSGFKCPICRDFVNSPDNRKSPQDWAISFKTNFHLDKLKIALEGNEGGDSDRRRSMCKVHPNTEEDLFCVQCGKQVCHLCSGISHRSCNLVVTLQEMEENRRADAQTVKDKMSEALQRSRDDVTRVKQHLDRVEGLKEGCKADVKRYTESIVSAIRRREGELVEEVEQRFNVLKERVDVKIDNFREEQRRFHQKLLCVESIAEGDTSNDAIKIYCKITSNKDLQCLDMSCMPSLSDQLEQVCVKFIRAHTGKQMSSYVTLGDVVLEKTPSIKVPEPKPKPQRVAFRDDHHVTLKVTPQISRFSKRRSNTITQSSESSTRPGKVTNIKAIPCKHQHDKHPPRLIDIEVLQSNLDDERSHTILVTDWNNECVKAYRSRRDRDSRLPVGGKPWCITALSQTSVAVSIPLSKQICVLGVGSTLVITSSVIAEKKYSGLVALTKTTLAACGGTVPPSVDIIDLSGEVLKSFSLDRKGAPMFSYPAYICSNPRGDIIVSDRDTKSVTCLNQDGSVRWRFRPEGGRELEEPAGVTCNSQGDVYVVEKRGMLCLTSEGQLKGAVLREQDAVESLKGVWSGRNGSVFITHKGDEICEFRLKTA